MGPREIVWSSLRCIRDARTDRAAAEFRRDHHAPQPRQAGRAGDQRDRRPAAAGERWRWSLIITVAGWNVLESAVAIQIAYIAIYLAFAFYAARWNRGVLPVAAVLAVILGIFALRGRTGLVRARQVRLRPPDYLSAGLLGVLTLLIVPVQILLVTFAMRGFSQGWNVELERRDSAASGGLHADAPPQPA
jgi:hypothetical protein